VLLTSINSRAAIAIRLAMVALVSASVLNAKYGPGTSGRELLATVLFAVCVICSVMWIAVIGRTSERTAYVWLLAAAGGFLTGAVPGSAASAFAFIAVVTAGFRRELRDAVPVVLVAALALAVSSLIYDNGAVGVLAYVLGFAAALLAATNAQQSAVRAEQAELLLAQSQRSHEEQLRAARLEESTRIARDIHDVLAHALAGLTIQLEATRVLIEQGVDRDELLQRVDRAHELARQGLRETRRAVGALRGDQVSVPAGLEALVGEFGDQAALSFDGDPERLEGPSADTVLRVVQEALTNVRKHAPGATVSVVVKAPVSGEVVVVVDDSAGSRPETNALASTGGGYGITGMRERAQALGGTLTAGASDHGWRVELHLPVPQEAR
jgi:signal transduction histidine kinase